jgi:hypothetical protein
MKQAMVNMLVCNEWLIMLYLVWSTCLLLWPFAGPRKKICVDANSKTYHLK